jgi:hypothetical protein
MATKKKEKTPLSEGLDLINKRDLAKVAAFVPKGEMDVLASATHREPGLVSIKSPEGGDSQAQVRNVDIPVFTDAQKFLYEAGAHDDLEITHNDYTLINQ